MRTTSYSISSTLGITEKINSKKCSGNFFAWKFSICTQVKFGGRGGGSTILGEHDSYGHGQLVISIDTVDEREASSSHIVFYSKFIERLSIY